MIIYQGAFIAVLAFIDELRCNDIPCGHGLARDAHEARRLLPLCATPIGYSIDERLLVNRLLVLGRRDISQRRLRHLVALGHQRQRLFAAAVALGIAREVVDGHDAGATGSGVAEFIAGGGRGR